MRRTSTSGSARQGGRRGARATQWASPVLVDWFAAWDDMVDGATRREARRYAARLTGTVSTTRSPDEDQARETLIADWLVRTAAPPWLRAAGQDAAASWLAALPPLTTARALETVGAAVETSARAARASHERARATALDTAASWAAPDASSGLSDGARVALHPLMTLLDPIRCRQAPLAWRAGARTIADAAGAIAWTAIAEAASSEAPPATADDAWRLAHTAAREALQPVEAQATRSACRLVDRLPGDGC